MKYRIMKLRDGMFDIRYFDPDAMTWRYLSGSSSLTIEEAESKLAKAIEYSKNDETVIREVEG